MIDPSWKLEIKDQWKQEWENNYLKYKEFYQKFGRFPRRGKDEIGSWFKEQKRLYSNSKMSKERIKLLDVIDPSWKLDQRELKWKKNYELLKEFYHEFGRFPRFKPYEEYKGLKITTWLKEQRNSLLRGRLSEERIKLLDAIDPNWKGSK